MPFGHAFPRLLSICRRYLTSCSSPEPEFPHVVQGLLKSTQRHTAANRLGEFHATFAIECCLARVVIDSNVDRAHLPVIVRVFVSLSRTCPKEFQTSNLRKPRKKRNNGRREISFPFAQVCRSDCCFSPCASNFSIIFFVFSFFFFFLFFFYRSNVEDR